MLRLLDPPPRGDPYPVPWRIDRIYGTHPLVTNESDEPADFVRAFVAPDQTIHLGQLLPGETVELCLCEHDPDAVVVTLAWFRPSTGAEFVWRFVL